MSRPPLPVHICRDNFTSMHLYSHSWLVQQELAAATIGSSIQFNIVGRCCALIYSGGLYSFQAIAPLQRNMHAP